MTTFFNLLECLLQSTKHASTNSHDFASILLCSHESFTMSSSPILQNSDFSSLEMNSRSFPFPLLHLSLASMLLILLISLPASSAYQEWFLNCKDSLNCESVGTIEFPLWRYDGTGSCGRPEAMKLNCEGSRRTTTQIFGAKFELLGFTTKDQILMVAEIDFSDQFCWGDHKNSSIPIYAIIPVSYECSNPTCFGTKFSYIPFENTTANADAYCKVSAVVPISPSLLLTELADLQKVEQNIRAEFLYEPKVDAQVCRSCTDPGGVCGYDLLLNQTRCYCSSPSNGFEVCSSSLIAASPPSGSGMNSNFELFLFSLRDCCNSSI